MMNINFFQENNSEKWNAFLIKNNGSFLQSFEWGESQKQFSHKIWRVVVNTNERKIFQAQVIKEKRAFVNYFYIPYGPVFDKNIMEEEKKQAFNLFLREIQLLAKKEKAVFLIIEPTVSLPQIENFDFKFLSRRIQPRKTSILNLEKLEQELLKNMQKKTRYNIKLAEKKGVKIEMSDSYLDIFYNLVKKTKKRQNFISHSEEHYKKLFEINSKDFRVKMFLTKYKEKTIIASIKIFFGNQITSLHTGSDYKYRSLKGMGLSHWNAFIYGKQQGYKTYDFWGIDEKKYPGVSDFKKGFGGKDLEYPAGINIVFDNNKYIIYNVMRKIKKYFKFYI